MLCSYTASSCDIAAALHSTVVRLCNRRVVIELGCGNVLGTGGCRFRLLRYDVAPDRHDGIAMLDEFGIGGCVDESRCQCADSDAGCADGLGEFVECFALGAASPSDDYADCDVNDCAR
jgi:hypothetical protein